MPLELLPGCAHPVEIGALFREYTDMLVQGDPAFACYLALQNYEKELARLSDKYGPPSGRLYLALWDGQPAGCVGLRRLDDASCEMKRLYVRPVFRGKRIGDVLVGRIIQDAKEIGYQIMRLDTLPFLQSAIHLYERWGFRSSSRYNDSPLDNTLYMERIL